MKFGTSHLLVIGAVLILFGLAVVVREEAFVEKQPDIKAEQHAEFEATAEQKEQLLHAAEAAGNSKSPAADVAPSSTKPSSAKLKQAEMDALMPGWLKSSEPAKPTAQTESWGLKKTPQEKPPPVPVPLKEEEKEEVEAKEEVVWQDKVEQKEVEGAKEEASKGQEMPPGATRVNPPSNKVLNCKSCAPVAVPAMCSWLNPMKDASPSGRRLQAAEPSAPRRSLLAKVRTAFQSADRTVLAKSRQPNFNPPSAELEAEVRAHLAAWREGPACGFWTRECVRRYRTNATADAEWVGRIRRGPRNVFKDKTFPPDGENFFPEVSKGELGSCAVVAVADNMLGKRRGPEIDAHDTVFRYNGPIKAYSRDIGSKGDVYYWKQRRDEKQYGQEGQRANKFYMWKAPDKYYMFADKKEWAAMTFHGKQMLWETGLGGIHFVYGKYAAENPDDSRHSPSGGFGLAWAVISSGLCERVDLYGFSAEGGGRYFKNAVVNVVHKIGLEHWSYRQAMESGHGVCIYD
uniref:Peptidase C1A papain C-terminal domain-containing protein n=1 Tax=Pyramimonas obovata TaxID=1411642 RepID=A0A7S0N8T3_9CHLO|mmetsp:Transcript_22115/g.48534  ORF Transcript_22115/g.48534 Transcript_22115/m.48534 type:complete len:516 (+) Transcript_22115:153-1700(+)|eukprot:CAMPEP_0118924088 /NCGR_PEP_ID=MMETSP1169-20130426/2380_1 /TAXON_ID=36882 /ORGANISM="Pyramimonas obovata, Strain CCMP722" /LENGTH=515 /DNA_ID=CAMNT_0006865171 /DNA_START=126 /DNA_END=1673 /DNA_ORIENTATION=+